MVSGTEEHTGYLEARQNTNRYGKGGTNGTENNESLGMLQGSYRHMRLEEDFFRQGGGAEERNSTGRVQWC